MDPLGCVSDEKLIVFFKRKKNEISGMKGFEIFLNQLKDDDLLSTEQYETMMKAKVKQKLVYKFLCGLEEKRPHCIRSFWRCVFQEHMLQKYPLLSILKASLQNEVFSKLDLFLNDLQKEKEAMEIEIPSPIMVPQAPEILHPTTTKKSAKDPEQVVKPGPSPIIIPDQTQPDSTGEKKQGMPSGTLFQSPLNNDEDDEHMLYPEMQARGEKNLLAESGRFTPNDFEKLGDKNWNQGVRHPNKPPKKIIETEQRQIPPTKKRCAEESEDESTPCSSASLRPHTFGAQAENQDINVKKKPKLGDVRSQNGNNLKVAGSPPEKHVQFEINKQQNQICCICKSAGDLVSCWDCQKSFHEHCHVPNLQDEILGSNWLCTFCVWKANEGLWDPVTYKQAMDSLVSSYTLVHRSPTHNNATDIRMTHRIASLISYGFVFGFFWQQCECLLMYMYEKDEQQLFANCAKTAEPIFGEIPALIWMNQVKLKLQNNEYHTVKEFAGELKASFLNYSFITKDVDVRREGFRLTKIFTQEFKKVFEIQ